MPTVALADPRGPDDEARLLAPWLAAFRRRFGAAPGLERDAHGLLLRFPALPGREPADALGRVDVLGGHPAVRAHLARLGFAWDDRGLLTRAPSPASFAARTRALGHVPGPRPRWYQAGSAAMNKRTWLEGCLRGEVPLALATPGWYAALAVQARLGLPEPRRVRAGRDYHFFGVQHDLTKHLVLLHLIPPDMLAALGRALAAGLRPWHRGPLVAAPLVRFYENDLLAYCQQIWRDLPDPAAFVPMFLAPANVAQLWRAVAARLAETAAGPHTWLRNDADTCPAFDLRRPACASGRP